MKFLIVLAAVFACALAAEQEDAQVTHYYGNKVVRVFPKSLEDYEVLHKLEEQGHLDFWTEIRRGSPTDVMVAPHQMKAFRATLLRNRMTFETLVEDVEQNIAAEREEMARAKQSGMNWDNYQRLPVIQAWLQELAQAYPNLVTVTNLGRSYLGNDMPLVKVSTGGSGKPAIWMDGNIHAREWIAPATTTYILNELVTQDHADLLAKFDFYFVPNVNPDGYLWTHSNARLWRKTRSNNASPLGCLGTDGNRNWGYLWGQPGASNDKCSDTYRGPSAFSEPENLLLKNYIEQNKDSINWLLFITFHSYGQYALLPYGDGTRPADYADLLAKANTFATALRGVYGTTYAVGNSEDLLYTTSGTSQDWAKGSGIFKYSYTFELRDKGTYGFQLPAAQIKPTGVETWTGVQALLRTL